MDKKPAIQESLLDFLSASFMVDVAEIPLDRSLVDEGIIDSFGLVEIAAYFEKTYSFRVEENEMTRDNFGSVLKMVAYIERRTGAGSQSREDDLTTGRASLKDGP